MGIEKTNQSVHEKNWVSLAVPFFQAVPFFLRNAVCLQKRKYEVAAFSFLWTRFRHGFQILTVIRQHRCSRSLLDRRRTLSACLFLCVVARRLLFQLLIEKCPGTRIQLINLGFEFPVRPLLPTMAAFLLRATACLR